MNLFRTLAASMLMLSAVGCCSMDPCGSSCQGPGGGGCLFSGLFNNCVCDDDYYDVYGYEVDTYDSGCNCGQCGHRPRKARRNRMVSRRGGYMNSFPGSGCCESMCDSCCGGGGDWVQGTMMTGGCGGCAGCAGGSPSTYAPGTSPSSPTLNTTPTPSSIAPIPPAGPNEPEPTPSGPGTVYRNQHGAQPQMVSYEEFQRLPGTVIAGPGITPNSQMTASSSPMTAPSLQMSASNTATTPSVPRVTSTPSQMTVRPAGLLPPSNVSSPAQQAVWTPAK